MCVRVCISIHIYTSTHISVYVYICKYIQVLAARRARPLHVQQASTSTHPHTQPGRKNKKSNKGGKGGAGEPGKEGAMPVTAEEACDKEEQADKINFLLVPLAAHSQVGPM